jgi:hypothetical protein
MNPPGQDFIQVLKVIAVYNQPLANRELIQLPLLNHVHMLQAILIDLPRHRQMVVALGARPNNSLADLHVLEQRDRL